MTLKLCLETWGRLSEIDKEWWQLLQSPPPSWQTLYFFQSSGVFLLPNECISVTQNSVIYKEWFTPTSEAQKPNRYCLYVRKVFAQKFKVNPWVRFFDNIWNISILFVKFPNCLEKLQDVKLSENFPDNLKVFVVYGLVGKFPDILERFLTIWKDSR